MNPTSYQNTNPPFLNHPYHLSKNLPSQVVDQSLPLSINPYIHSSNHTYFPYNQHDPHLQQSMNYYNMVDPFVKFTHNQFDVVRYHQSQMNNHHMNVPQYKSIEEQCEEIFQEFKQDVERTYGVGLHQRDNIGFLKGLTKSDEFGNILKKINVEMLKDEEEELIRGDLKKIENLVCVLKGYEDIVDSREIVEGERKRVDKSMEYCCERIREKLIKYNVKEVFLDLEVENREEKKEIVFSKVIGKIRKGRKVREKRRRLNAIKEIQKQFYTRDVKKREMEREDLKVSIWQKQRNQQEAKRKQEKEFKINILKCENRIKLLKERKKQRENLLRKILLLNEIQKKNKK